MTRLPDFFVLGAAKAGTTALHEYFAAREDCVLPRIKETNFFSLGRQSEPFCGPGDHEALNRSPLVRQVRTKQAYLEQFGPLRSEQKMGEVCPTYLYWPQTAEVLAQTVPSAKLIAILRHPAERAYSSYLMLREAGREQEKDFERALALEAERRAKGWEHAWHYTEMGRYGQQLKRYYALFPSDSIKVVFYQDLLRQPEDTLRSLVDFLDLDRQGSDWRLPRANPSGLPKHNILDRALREPFMGKSGLRRLIPRSWRVRAGRTIRTSNLERPPLDRLLKEKILTQLRSDGSELEALVGRPVPWLQDSSEESL